ncbi:unnamed protein product [Rhizoctonia solani]|uniref:Ubiquitin-like domain-containing protein n=1 Tax=Rhizoctonia solani TaxID=456999 RepID=A0A8H3BP87_9AGAM|nr:unnamed protein product [Rhizoctonia solani]CAE6483142.1 unnamed protein product [Rhizoctonia solani]
MQLRIQDITQEIKTIEIHESAMVYDLQVALKEKGFPYKKIWHAGMRLDDHLGESLDNLSVTADSGHVVLVSNE